MAIPGSKIAAVGQAESRQNLPPAAQRWNAAGNLVMPGLINCHCHAAMTLFRGWRMICPWNTGCIGIYFPPKPAGWILILPMPGRGSAAAELIRGGVTCVADAYFWAAGARQAFREAGLRAVVAQGVIDFPAPGVPEPADNLHVAREFIDRGPKFRLRADHFEPVLSLALYLQRRHPASRQGRHPGA